MVSKGVQENVRMQAEVGIDIPSDGEVGKPSFAGYITERLGGLQATTEAPKSADNPMNYPILNEEFPGFMAQYNAMYRTIWMPRSIPRDLVDAAVERTRNERVIVSDKITYQGQADIKRDLDGVQGSAPGAPVRGGVRPRRHALPERRGPRADLPERAGVPLRRRRRDARGVPGDRRRRLHRAARPGATGPNQVLPGKPRPTWEELRRASEMQVEASTTPCRASPRSGCATTSAGAA